MSDSGLILEVHQMTKLYGSITALKNVDFKAYRGHVVGLIGENGSGKSTLTSIIAGMQNATSGQMIFKGKPWNPKSMIEAEKNGVSMILQESNTIPNVTVAENIFAGKEPQFTHWGIFNKKKMISEANQLLKGYQLDFIRAEDEINQYSFEERKLIEIVRSIHAETELLIIDETTTALSHEGREILYKLIKEMTDQSKAVIFISHDMDEIIERCDIFTVLRDGEERGTLNKTTDQINQQLSELRRLMVGRVIGENLFPKKKRMNAGNRVAHMNKITAGKLKDFSLDLYEGQILGLGGLSGSGMHDIGRILFGLAKIDDGEVEIYNTKVKNSKIAVENGMAYISKNRDLESLIGEDSIRMNLVYPSLPDIKKKMFVRPSDESHLANQQIKELAIKCESGNQTVNTLSGGNKQKVAFGKWLAKQSEVIIMDCPTRGVDIGVKEAMYQIIENMRREGKAILLISEELPELINMSDKILVMKDYKVSKVFDNTEDLEEIDIVEHMI